MRILFIDTETTGIPNSSLAPSDKRQARLVQFAAVLHDSHRKERHAVSMLVNPQIDIPETATGVHGITQEDVALFGVPEVAVVGLYLRLAAQADVLSGYNVGFDDKMMRLAFDRANLRTTWPTLEIRDVCAACSPIVNLPPTERMVAAGFGDKPKTPKLVEAYSHFFDESLSGAHDALIDVRAAARVYYEIADRCWKEAA